MNTSAASFNGNARVAQLPSAGGKRAGGARVFGVEFQLCLRQIDS